eukprot:352088-Chlamydomonas_euryale.AAC.9
MHRRRSKLCSPWGWFNSSVPVWKKGSTRVQANPGRTFNVGDDPASVGWMLSSHHEVERPEADVALQSARSRHHVAVAVEQHRGAASSCTPSASDAAASVLSNLPSSCIGTGGKWWAAAMSTNASISRLAATACCVVSIRVGNTWPSSSWSPRSGSRQRPARYRNIACDCFSTTASTRGAMCSARMLSAAAMLLASCRCAARRTSRELSAGERSSLVLAVTTASGTRRRLAHATATEPTAAARVELPPMMVLVVRAALPMTTSPASCDVM